jgi:hypothetical protein
MGWLRAQHNSGLAGGMEGQSSGMDRETSKAGRAEREREREREREEDGHSERGKKKNFTVIVRP